MDNGLASLISGGIGSIASLIDTNRQVKAQKEYNKGQMELAKYQADRNYQLWQENNAYNSPTAQMTRLKSAGLNPNLIYDNGRGATGLSSSPAESYNIPAQQVVDYGHMFGNATASFIQGLQAFANIQKTNAETENLYQSLSNLQEDNNLKKLTAIGIGYSNAKTKEEANVWRDKLFAELAVADSTSVNLRSNAELNDSRRFTENALKDYRKSYLKTQIDKNLYELNVTNPEKIREIRSRILNISADTSAKNLENVITKTLINEGVNLRGGAAERYINQIVNSLSELTDENLPSWLNWLPRVARSVKLPQLSPFIPR